MAPLLDFISDQGVKKAKGKQKAGKSKKTHQEMGPQKSLKGQERYPLESTNSKEFQPVLVEPIKGKSLSCDPDKIASKIKEAREDPDSNVWNLPMFDFSRDQIMQYVDGYFGAERSKILSSIHNRDPTFPRMVCTAVKYWNDKQLIVPLLRMVKEVFKSSTDSKGTYHLLMSGKVELSIVLLACFLDEEDSFERVLGILLVSISSPFSINYDKSAEELLLILSSSPTYPKRIKMNSPTLLHVWSLIQCLACTMQIFCDESNRQKAKRLLVRKGIVDVIIKVLRTLKVVAYPSRDTSLIQDISIIAISWLSEEMEAIDMVTIFPRVLESMDRILQNQTLSTDSYILNQCITSL